jgi:hypothetical protein
MKKFFVLILLPILCHSSIYDDRFVGPTEAKEITFDWLTHAAVQPHETHHVLIFKKIFENTKIRTLLEFGLGYSTKYFLDQCTKVISVDIITHGYGPDVMKKFMRIYSDYSNWIPIAMFSGYIGLEYDWAPYKHMASESIYKATSYACAYHKNYSKIDDFYLVEMDAFIKNLLKYNKANLAFVGHATFIRGEVVQLLFDKVPIIVAHNTNKRKIGDQDDPYNLVRLVTPQNYEEIYFASEGGTTVWVQKNEKNKNLIEVLKQYAEQPI